MLYYCTSPRIYLSPAPLEMLQKSLPEIRESPFHEAMEILAQTHFRLQVGHRHSLSPKTTGKSLPRLLNPPFLHPNTNCSKIIAAVTVTLQLHPGTAIIPLVRQFRTSVQLRKKKRRKNRRYRPKPDSGCIIRR